MEKRKVDIRKAEGYSNARSTWPLFDNLRFLDGHIRPRKSYKCMIRRVRPVGRPRRNHRQDDFVLYNEEAHPTQYANPVALHQQGFQIKYEPDAIGSGSGGGHNDSNMYNSGYESYAIHILLNYKYLIDLCSHSFLFLYILETMMEMVKAIARVADKMAKGTVTMNNS